jgi:hypothetical protein
MLEQLFRKNLHLTIETCIYHTHKWTLKSIPYIQITKGQCDPNFSKKSKPPSSLKTTANGINHQKSFKDLCQWSEGFE